MPGEPHPAGPGTEWQAGPAPRPSFCQAPKVPRLVLEPALGPRSGGRRLRCSVVQSAPSGAVDPFRPHGHAGRYKQQGCAFAPDPSVVAVVERRALGRSPVPKPRGRPVAAAAAGAAGTPGWQPRVEELAATLLPPAHPKCFPKAAPAAGQTQRSEQERQALAPHPTHAPVHPEGQRPP